MRTNMYYLLAVLFVFGSKFDVAVTKAMLGENARQARPQEFPYVVSIKIINEYNSEPEYDHVCTGVLVSNRDVISVVHCFTNLKLQNTEIIIGSNDIREGNKYHPAWWLSYDEWVIMRNRNQMSTNNDISIIRLNETVPDNISPATLSYIMQEDLQGANVRVAGFGKTNTGEISRIMETANFNLISRKECEKRINKVQKETFVLVEQYVCASASPPVLLTHGSSGSAVLSHGQLIAIHLGTYPNHLQEHDTRKTNIFLFLERYRYFIDDIKYHF